MSARSEQGAPNYQPNPLGLWVAIAGAIVTVIGCFLPFTSPPNSIPIKDNTAIQNGDGWIAIVFTVALLSAIYRSWTTRRRSWMPLVMGALIVGLAIDEGKSDHTLTYSGALGKLIGEVNGGVGIGIYGIGVGGALGIIGGRIMRNQGDNRLQTHKECPECAEMVQARAQICRYCGHRFSQVPVESPARE